jgi:ankyrin repeat protein
MMAAAFNRVEMVRWLLEHSASVDARDAAGLRAIDVARAMGATDAAAILS